MDGRQTAEAWTVRPGGRRRGVRWLIVALCMASLVACTNMRIDLAPEGDATCDLDACDEGDDGADEAEDAEGDEG